jgi:hypothetical protein
MTSAMRCLGGQSRPGGVWGTGLHEKEPGTPEAKGPDWDRLLETAAAQCGYVTTKQAAEAGYSTHLLRKHIEVDPISWTASSCGHRE